MKVPVWSCEGQRPERAQRDCNLYMQPPGTDFLTCQIYDMFSLGKTDCMCVGVCVCVCVVRSVTVVLVWSSAVVQHVAHRLTL